MSWAGDSKREADVTTSNLSFGCSFYLFIYFEKGGKKAVETGEIEHGQSRSAPWSSGGRQAGWARGRERYAVQTIFYIERPLAFLFFFFFIPFAYIETVRRMTKHAFDSWCSRILSEFYVKTGYQAAPCFQLELGQPSFFVQKPGNLWVEVCGAWGFVLESISGPRDYQAELTCAVETSLWRDAEFGIEGTSRRT